MNPGKGIKSQLIGTGGTYYVMAQLAVRGYHASCTFGNAPFVDILVASPDGHRTLSIQVKTAWNARRWKNNVVSELQWTLGYKAAKQANPSLFLAFVDLKNLSEREPPDVYIIPSSWIKDYCAPCIDQWKWVRFHVDPDRVEEFKNNWSQISEALSEGRS